MEIENKKNCLIYCGPERCDCQRSVLQYARPPSVPFMPTIEMDDDSKIETTFGILRQKNSEIDLYKKKFVDILIENTLLISRQPKSLNQMSGEIHQDNYRWWHDLNTGERLARNKGEMLMLIVSEIAEAMEGERKDLMDTHLTHRKMVEVEMADAIIRILDYAGAYGFDLDGAIKEKREYNKTRVDHSKEARQAPGGKKF